MAAGERVGVDPVTLSALSGTPEMRAADQDTVDNDALGPVGPWAAIPEYRNSKFFAEFLNRLVTGRDMNIVVTAASETGVGKTTLAVALAILMDQQGWEHHKASVADPVEYDRKYDQASPGEVLILDEAEKAMDARRGMTKESVELTQSFATKRYKQVFSIMTAPSKSWIDKRLGSDAGDYWIQCQQTDLGRIKGEAMVYRLKENEHYQQDYQKRTEMIHWPAIDWHDELQALDDRKVELLETDDESKTYYHKDEVDDLLEDHSKSAEKRLRKQFFEKMNNIDGVTQAQIASEFDVSQSRISQIVNS